MKDSRVKNPTRWLQRMIRRTATGVGHAGRRLTHATMGAREAIDRTLAKAPPLAIDIFIIWVRQLVLTAIELGIGWVTRKIIARPKPARVILFPTPNPVP